MGNDCMPASPACPARTKGGCSQQRHVPTTENEMEGARRSTDGSCPEHTLWSFSSWRESCGNLVVAESLMIMNRVLQELGEGCGNHCCT